VKLQAGLAAAIVAGGAAAVVADRWLARLGGSSDGSMPVPIDTRVVIDAPIADVWATLVDIERQPLWMTDLKDVRVETPGPATFGTRAIGRVRILGLSLSDPVVVVEFEPPRRYSIRHDGFVRGWGEMELRPGADGTSTIITWSETLIAPFLPFLGVIVARPVLAHVFQADLHRLRQLFEGADRAPFAVG
jgi:uncharacterized protein YndB with AHSA1/START domain